MDVVHTLLPDERLGLFFPNEGKSGVLGMVVGQHHELIQRYNYGRVSLSVLYIYTVAYVFHMLSFSYPTGIPVPRDYNTVEADSNLSPYSVSHGFDVRRLVRRAVL